jgi:hypothetical protein
MVGTTARCSSPATYWAFITARPAVRAVVERVDLGDEERREGTPLLVALRSK